MVKSPLRYPGGKSRAIPHLRLFIPGFRECREVFFGGGSLSFYGVQHFTGRQFSASDLNYELYCFWQELKTNGEALIKGVQNLYDEYKTPLQTVNATGGKRLFELLVKRRADNLTTLQRAIDFYVLNRITFSGVVDSGGYSQGSFEGRFTQTSVHRLQATAPVIQHISFYCEDYQFLVTKPGKDVFLFLDPPYYAATKSKLYGKNGILHTQFDHEKLKHVLEHTTHQWLLTYDNSEFIKRLYKDFSQAEWKLQYGMTTRNNANAGTGNELLIANYDLAKMRLQNEEKIKAKQS